MTFLATLAIAATSLGIIPAPVSTEVGDGSYKMTGKKNEIRPRPRPRPVFSMPARR